MNVRMLMLAIVVGLALVAAPAFAAYQEISVEQGGTLQGTVTLHGEVPKPKGYNLVSFPDPVYCGRISNGQGWRLLQPFQVGPKGEFQNVVIYFKRVEKGKPFKFTPPLIEAKDCRFEPYITVVRDPGNVKVVNMDPVMHDIQAYETSKHGARVLFNDPLPMSPKLRKQDLMAGKTVKNRAGKIMIEKVKMRRGRNIFAMQCGFHPYMESWGVAVKNPYYALTDEQGKFVIDEIPPGTYQVVAWHPMLTKEFTVTIEPNQTTTLDIEFEAPKGRLYVNEAQEQTRFGMELLGGSKIVPTVELQK